MIWLTLSGHHNDISSAHVGLRACSVGSPPLCWSLHLPFFFCLLSTLTRSHPEIELFSPSVDLFKLAFHSHQNNCTGAIWPSNTLNHLVALSNGMCFGNVHLVHEEYGLSTLSILVVLQHQIAPCRVEIPPTFALTSHSL